MNVYEVDGSYEMPSGQEVEPDSWLYSEGGILITNDVSSCLVIAIHHAETHSGYLGHVQTPFYRKGTGLIREVAKRVIDYTTKAKIKPFEPVVWLGGMSGSAKDLSPHNISLNESEHAAIEILTEADLTNIIINRLDTNRYRGRVALNTSSSDLFYSSEKMPINQ